MPLTILGCAIARGAKPDDTGSFTMDAIVSAGFSFLGGCVSCRATIAAYNAYPSIGGYWCCKQCIGSNGFESITQFDEWCRAEEKRDAKFDEFCNRQR